MKRAPSVPSGEEGSQCAVGCISHGRLVMVGRILSFVQSCKKLRTPVHSGKILFVEGYRLFVGRYRLFVRAK